MGCHFSAEALILNIISAADFPVEGLVSSAVSSCKSSKLACEFECAGLTSCSREILSRSPSVSSFSIRLVRTPSLALKPGAWKCSFPRSVKPLLSPVSDFPKSLRSVIRTTKVMASSTEPTNEVTFQALEEEVWEGCTLQHGMMSAGNVKIHYVEAGDPSGRLVVLLHGFPNLWFVWRNQFKPLVDAGYHVIAPDLRGYNLSTKFETVQDYGRAAVLPDIEKLIDHFGAGKPAILAGHDWGTIIAWAFVEDYQSKVERLVATNMGRLNEFQKILKSNYRQTLKSWYIGFFQLPFVPEWYFKSTLMKSVRNIKSASSGATDEDMKRMEEAMSRPGSVMGAISYYRAAYKGLWNRPDKTVPVINIPVTTLWGDQDAYIVPEVGETNIEKAPRFKLLHLLESGHWPMWDEPALYNKLFLEAISGNDDHADG